MNLNQCKNYAHASSKGLGNKAHFALTISRLAIVQTVEATKLGWLVGQPRLFDCLIVFTKSFKVSYLNL